MHCLSNWPPAKLGRTPREEPILINPALRKMWEQQIPTRVTTINKLSWHGIPQTVGLSENYHQEASAYWASETEKDPLPWFKGLLVQYGVMNKTSLIWKHGAG